MNTLRWIEIRKIKLIFINKINYSSRMRNQYFASMNVRNARLLLFSYAIVKGTFQLGLRSVLFAAWAGMASFCIPRSVRRSFVALPSKHALYRVLCFLSQDDLRTKCVFAPHASFSARRFPPTIFQHGKNWPELVCTTLVLWAFLWCCDFFCIFSVNFYKHRSSALPRSRCHSALEEKWAPSAQREDIKNLRITRHSSHLAQIV